MFVVSGLFAIFVLGILCIRLIRLRGVVPERAENIAATLVMQDVAHSAEDADNEHSEEFELATNLRGDIHTDIPRHSHVDHAELSGKSVAE